MQTDVLFRVSGCKFVVQCIETCGAMQERSLGEGFLGCPGLCFVASCGPNLILIATQKKTEGPSPEHEQQHQTGAWTVIMEKDRF